MKLHTFSESIHYIVFKKKLESLELSVISGHIVVKHYSVYDNQLIKLAQTVNGKVFPVHTM
jgi:hypothetical protein